MRRRQRQHDEERLVAMTLDERFGFLKEVLGQFRQVGTTFQFNDRVALAFIEGQRAHIVAVAEAKEPVEAEPGGRPVGCHMA